VALGGDGFCGCGCGARIVGSVCVWVRPGSAGGVSAAVVVAVVVTEALAVVLVRAWLVCAVFVVVVAVRVSVAFA
jgi:hypothetical protein